MRLFYSFIFAVLAISCSNNHIAEKHFEEGCWNIGDTLEFNFEPVSSTNKNVTVEVSFLENYSFRNLYFKWLIVSPSGKTRSLMRHQVMIDEAGYWQEDLSRGHYVFTFPDSIKFEEKGMHNIKLFHYMREENLCDIEQIAVDVH